MGINSKQGCIAAIFDLDFTITIRDSFKYFLIKEYLNKPQNFRYVPNVFFYAIMRKKRIISLKKFKEKALVSLVGMSQPSLKNVGRDFFEKYLIKTIRALAKDTIKWHQTNGHMVFIISASPDIYVKPVAGYLNCDDYECSRLVYQDNKFIGKVFGKDCYGPEKAKKLQKFTVKHNINLKESYCYSDHESDFPLLESVGKPIVVSPTSVLQKIATKRSWKIVKW